MIADLQPYLFAQLADNILRLAQKQSNRGPVLKPLRLHLRRQILASLFQVGVRAWCQGGLPHQAVQFVRLFSFRKDLKYHSLKWTHEYTNNRNA